jgi:PadR family transcriptional regulator PadR
MTTSDEIRGHLDALVLAVLAEGPAHGYLVITRLADRTSRMLDLAEGTVYPVLHRLEDADLLSADWIRVQGRRRKVYTITKAGRRELSARRNRWHSFRATIDLFLGATA